MNLANNITIFRILLIPFFVEMILKFNQLPAGEGEQYRWAAVAIFSLAVFTDAIDGFIARRRHQITEFGKALDPIADKLLLLSAIVILSLRGRFMSLPLWFVVTVLSRDVIIVLGALMLHLFKGSVKIAPSFLGKTTTVAQMVTILWIMLGLARPEVVWRITGILTVLSGLFYVVAGSKQINEPAVSK